MTAPLHAENRSRRWMLVASMLGVAAIVALALVARSRDASAKSSKVATPAPAAAVLTTTPHTPKEILPPGYERYKPAGPPEMIDPQVEWANAQELALKRFPDARVSEL